MSNNKIDTIPREVALAIYNRRLEGASWRDIRHEFDIDRKTATLLLTKHALDHSPASAVNPSATEMWERPCLRCGKCERRAKGLFRCKACREDARSMFNASDAMYQGVTYGSSRRGGVAGGL